MSYYVRTDGNDNNTGTANTPEAAFLTITHGISVLGDGETLWIADGTYEENSLTINRAWADIANIRSLSANPDAVKITCPDSGVPLTLDSTSAYVALYDLTFEASGNSTTVAVCNSLDLALLSNCKFRYTSATGSASVITQSGYLEINNCQIIQTGGASGVTGLHQSGGSLTVSGLTITGVTGDSIHSTASNAGSLANVTVSNSAPTRVENGIAWNFTNLTIPGGLVLTNCTQSNHTESGKNGTKLCGSAIVPLTTTETMTGGTKLDGSAVVSVVGTRRFWLGSNTDWFSTANWSSTTGGVAGDSVPNNTNDVWYDGAGLGDCTLTGDCEAKSLTFANAYTGKLTDSGHTITLYGALRDLHASPVTNKPILATGTVVFAASAANQYNNYSARLYRIQFNTGVSCSGPLQSRYYVSLGAGTLSGTWGVHPLAGSTDALSLNPATTVSANINIYLPGAGTTCYQGAINTSGALSVAWGQGLVVMTGNWQCYNTNLYGSWTTDTAETGSTIDTNGYNFSCVGNLQIGWSDNTYYGYCGRIFFRSGTHNIGGTIKSGRSGSQYTRGFIDWGDENVSFGAFLPADITSTWRNKGSSGIQVDGLAVSSEDYNSLTVVGGINLGGSSQVSCVVGDTGTGGLRLGGAGLATLGQRTLRGSVQVQSLLSGALSIQSAIEADLEVVGIPSGELQLI